jgi:predicted membrane-bound spermidine synthase
MGRKLVVNGTGMTYLTPITKIMAHVPLALLDRPPQNGLVICFGMGTTFRSMLSGGKDTTVVELVPSVPKLFGYYHADGPELLKSPSAHVVIDDGRRFLERSRGQYDVKTLDPPPTVGAPTSSLLYSREFDGILKAHLRPGGILHVWLPTLDVARWGSGVSPGDQAAVAKALQRCFPHVRAFESVEGWGLHFLASDQPFPPLDPVKLASRLHAPAASDLVEWGPASTPEGMFEKAFQHEKPLEDLIAEDPGVPALHDNKPINEYFFLRLSFH